MVGLISLLVDLVVLFGVFGGSFGVPEYYVEDHCSQTLALDFGSIEAVRLKLTKATKYPDGMQCTMRVQAPPGKKLQIHIERFDVKGLPDLMCQSGDYVQFLDGTGGQSRVIQGLPNRVCALPQMRNYVTTDRYLVVRFMSDRDMVSGRGVKMILTAFSEAPCTGEQFMCKSSSRCIQKSLKCDGTRNCPDQSDEAMPMCLSAAAIGGMAVGCGIVLIAIIIIIILACLRRKKKKEDRTIKLNYDSETKKVTKSKPYMSSNSNSTGVIRTGL